MRRTPSRRRSQRVDQALVVLVRLVWDETWTVRCAGDQLWSEVPDQLALRGARARVLGAMTGRRTALGERSVAILDAALEVGTARTDADGRHGTMEVHPC